MRLLLVCAIAPLLLLGAAAVLPKKTVESAVLAVRDPAVAGRFYPGEAPKLEAAIRGFLADAVPPRGQRPVALVAPHAGYIYSAQIAADAWTQARGGDYDLVVLLGTNHTVPRFEGAAISPAAGFRTPLGVAEVDRKAAADLIAHDSSFTRDDVPHEREHSVEVQVPFAQVVLPGVKILPIVVGDPDPQLCARLGRALAKVLSSRRPLLVASSDLSHYPAYDDAVTSDGATLAAIAGMDASAIRSSIAAQLRANRPNLSTCACGEAPVLVALEAARTLGAARGVVLSYANSGDTVVGDRGRVVGYGAVAFFPGPPGRDLAGLGRPAAAAQDAPIGTQERKALLRIARESIRRFLETGTAPLVRDVAPSLRRLQGAFVTLKKRGELRGCIGHTAQDTPLGQVVGAMAVQAAFNDRRFSPLEARELPEVELDVSVLTPLAAVAGPDAIVLGRDGVVIRKEGRSALFLPEVAVEQGWTREEMLEHLCRKAGLPSDAWRRGAEFLTFRTIAIHENEKESSAEPEAGS